MEPRGIFSNGGNMWVQGQVSECAGPTALQIGSVSKRFWLRCGRRLPLPSVASGAARPVNKLKKVGQGWPMQEGSLASSETKAYHSPSNSCKKLVTMRLLRLTVHVYVYDTFSRAGWRTTVWAFFGGWGRAISNKTTFTILHLLKP